MNTRHGRGGARATAAYIFLALLSTALAVFLLALFKEPTPPQAAAAAAGAMTFFLCTTKMGRA